MKKGINFKRIRFIVLDLFGGTSILRILSKMHHEQYLPAELLREQTRADLYSLFLLAATQTDFYSTSTSYESLPVLTKEDIKAQPHSFKSKAFRKRLFSKSTGGSTGIPLVYFTTEEARSYMWAGIILSWESAGYLLGEKVAFLAGTSLSKSDYKHKLFYRLMNIEVYSAYQLDEAGIENHIKGIQSSRARIIYGYSSALDTMATYMNSKGPFQFPFLRAIVSTAEVLTDSMRKNISEAFNVEVYNQYGCNEAGISAFECEHHNMHLISSRCYYETDSVGQLISTDLSNKGYIMLKYNTGDIVEFSEDAVCPCNRNYPIISNVIGRSFDVVRDMQHKVVHAAFFNILFRNDSTIRQYQIRYSKYYLQVYLRTENTAPSASLYAPYMDKIRSYLSFENYELILNAPFLQSTNAKHKHIVFVDI